MTARNPLRRLDSRRTERYTIHPRRAYEVLDILVPAFENSVHPFGQSHWLLPEQSITLPDELEQNPAALANFYFWSCMFMRGRIKSVHAIQRLLRLYMTELEANRANIHNPYVAVGLSEDYIISVLGEYGLSKYGHGWKLNAQRLIDRYNGNALKALEGITTFEEACRRFCNKNGRGYWGFQKKMTSMILYYLVEANLIKPFPFPPPVDWHHASLAWRLGILDLHGNVLSGDSDLEDGCLEDLRDIYMRYAKLRGASTISIAKACWLLSSYLCSPAPGNNLIERGKYKARSTKLVHAAPNFETAPPSVIDAWQRTCGLCPVSHRCDKLMSSAQWTDRGELGSLFAKRTAPSPECLAEAGLFNAYELVGPLERKTRIKVPISSNTQPLTTPIESVVEQLLLF